MGRTGRVGSVPENRDRRSYYLANKARHQANGRAWYLRNREKVLSKTRKRNGIPSPTRERPDHCECCGKPANVGGAIGSREILSMDHDHATGKFRGWLCLLCNTGIGKLGDSIDGLRQALEYLERNS